MRLEASLLSLLYAATGAASAANVDVQARDAGRDGLAAITIYVDANWGSRTDGAAKALTRAHAAFAAQGYELVDVAPYDENGDLQGFFVSYRRRDPH